MTDPQQRVSSLTQMIRSAIARIEQQRIFEAWQVIDDVLDQMNTPLARKAKAVNHGGWKRAAAAEMALFVGVQKRVQCQLADAKEQTRRGWIRRFLCWSVPGRTRSYYALRGGLTAVMGNRIIEDRDNKIHGLTREKELWQSTLPFMEEFTTRTGQPATFDDVREAAGF